MIQSEETPSVYPPAARKRNPLIEPYATNPAHMTPSGVKTEMIPLPVGYLLIGVSIVLNFTGLAGIVDGLVVWEGFFREIVTQYDHLVRRPILSVVIEIIPLGWPIPPKWSCDFVVIWGSSFLGYRMSIMFDRKYSPFRGAGDFIGVLLAGPFIIFLFVGVFIFARKLASRVTEQMFLDHPSSIGPEYARAIERKNKGLHNRDIDDEKLLSEFREARKSHEFRQEVEQELNRIRRFCARTLCFLLLPYAAALGAMFLNFQVAHGTV